MTFWADTKAAARRQVHKTFAVRCLYRERTDSVPVELTARLHTRMVIGGNDGSAGYATIIEGVTRVIFNREELVLANVIPKRNAMVTFPEYGNSYALDIRDPYAGAVTEKWTLAGL